jgi:LysR family glycine cleavage system transcriptional activator
LQQADNRENFRGSWRKSTVSTRHIPALNGLRAFEALARQGTLSRAAEELCVTPSAISHQVRALEKWLDIRLFEGNGGARHLTIEGKRFASTLNGAFDTIDMACRALRHSSRTTDIHVNVTPTFAIRWLLPRLGRFQIRYPNISVNITTSAQPVDFDREDVHAALRFGKGPWPGLTADLLFMEDIFPVCHPSLLDEPNGLCDPRALKHHSLLHTMHRRHDWLHWLKAAGVSKADVDPTQGLTFDLTTMAIDAAEAKLGVAITREAQVLDRLKKGALVAPFRKDLLRGEGCYFLSRPERYDEPQITAFRGWLLEEAAR